MFSCLIWSSMLINDQCWLLSGKATISDCVFVFFHDCFGVHGSQCMPLLTSVRCYWVVSLLYVCSFFFLIAEKKYEMKGIKHVSTAGSPNSVIRGRAEVLRMRLGARVPAPGRLKKKEKDILLYVFFFGLAIKSMIKTVWFCMLQINVIEPNVKTNRCWRFLLFPKKFCTCFQ